jgi:uncharacterized membrane-anchored protein YhcB (DUF1043 family)
MDTAAVGTVTGVVGVAVGVIASAFAWGRRYGQKVDNDEDKDARMTKLERQIVDCKKEEATKFKDLALLLNQCNSSMATLSTSVACLNTSLQTFVKQSDLIPITNRIAHLEGSLNR